MKTIRPTFAKKLGSGSPLAPQPRGKSVPTAQQWNRLMRSMDVKLGAAERATNELLARQARK